MDNEGRTLVVLRLLLEIIKLVMGMSEEATDDKIKKTRDEIKDAVAKWQ